MSANEVIKLRSTDESKGLESVEPQAFTDELPAGTRLLNKQYTITGYLNSGGFGITYIAEDSLHRTVVIKECFPGFMCRRVGKDVHVRSIEHHGELASIVTAFINEARALAALDHEGIVKVHQVFEENNTAYMAMDYVKGLDLAEIIDRHPGAVSPARIFRSGLAASTSTRNVRVVSSADRDTKVTVPRISSPLTRLAPAVAPTVTF